MMNRKTYTAAEVANYLLAITDPENNDMSNLKLQKLCYYAQGVCTSMRGTALFNDPIEAWDHGPVVPNLYHAQKVNKAAAIPIPDGFDVNFIDEPDRTALTDLYEYYGQFSAWRLRNMTHEEKPWIDAHKSNTKIITLDALVSHFGPQVDEDYRKTIYGK